MIKAIAFDMDGTFLNPASDYDHEYFNRLWPRIQAAGISLVVASGNPYYQLRGRFLQTADEMDFVAENGVECFTRGQMVYCGEIKPDVQDAIWRLHQYIPGSDFLLSGLHTSYIPVTERDAFIDRIQPHYPNIRRISRLDEIDDRIVKLLLDVPRDRTLELQQKINHDFGDQLTAVSSGFGNLDLIVAGMDKAYGLRKLMNRHGWQADEVMAFGDGQNDATMLQLAGTSYAMANGGPEAKAAAKHMAPSNAENGVLKTIEQYLDQL